MDQNWLNNLDRQTALIVPTRSLANALNEQFARHNVSQGQTVWEAPNIHVWSDFLRMLWQLNRAALSNEFGTHTLITAQQSLLLWTQVIEASRREESELTLLNVQQTSNAVQRSWRLMNDWQIDAKTIQQDHVADTEQFITWVETYRALLAKRGLIDESCLLTMLQTVAMRQPYSKHVWVSYDLVTRAQQAFIDSVKTQGVEVEMVRPNLLKKSASYTVFTDAKQEIEAALVAARVNLEQDPSHTANIVIPDLQRRQAQVRELARKVFYPAASPLSVQQNNTVYRFSLGQPIGDSAAIEAAISIITLLRNRTTVLDLSFLLRNQFLGLAAQHRDECRLFERWLKRQRLHDLVVDRLPNLYQDYLDADATQERLLLPTKEIEREGQAGDVKQTSELHSVLSSLVAYRQQLMKRLQTAKVQSNFAALTFAEWAEVFGGWLAIWGWRPAKAGSELSSVQYQLQQRWLGLLEEFVGLGTVQHRAGLGRAIDVLKQMARSTVFLPKGVASPILISGVFEAIGQSVDTCYLTGMHQNYPPPGVSDAFIPNRLLVTAGHPEATADSSFCHAQRVIDNLLRCANHHVVSYGTANDTDRGLMFGVSPLFQNQTFQINKPISQKAGRPPVTLETYADTQGPSWASADRAKGGASIFENQSNCAFKAFATHQLGFLRDDETEFGLDGLDRGNVIHHLLDLVWAELQTQRQLIALDEVARTKLVDTVIERSFEHGGFRLGENKLILLKHEKPRLRDLLLDWLALEAQRPEHFSVVEREEQRYGEIAGIKFSYVIDRLDMTDDGRSLIIDYKTGMVDRKDWVGERMKSPQMPLYALALDSQKNTPVSGIAFAKLKSGEHKFIELADAGIVRKQTKREENIAADWLDNRRQWPQIFAQLAADFLAGQASVNPIDDTTCQYCELHSLCRISQLKDREICND